MIIPDQNILAPYLASQYLCSLLHGIGILSTTAKIDNVSFLVLQVIQMSHF